MRNYEATRFVRLDCWEVVLRMIVHHKIHGEYQLL